MADALETDESEDHGGLFDKISNFFVDITPDPTTEADLTVADSSAGKSSAGKSPTPNVGVSNPPRTAQVAGVGRVLVDQNILSVLMDQLDQEATPKIQGFLETYKGLAAVQPPAQAYQGALALSKVSKKEISEFIQRKQDKLGVVKADYVSKMELSRTNQVAECDIKKKDLETNLSSIDQQIASLQADRNQISNDLNAAAGEIIKINDSHEQNKGIFEATVAEATRLLTAESEQLLS